MRRFLLFCLTILSIVTVRAFASEPTVSPDLTSLKSLAEKGNADSQYELGLLYLQGKGMPQDCKEAAKWVHKAAEQGNAGAQGLLGAFYQAGIGVPKNDAESVKWYRKAAEQGIAASQFQLGAMYERGLMGVPQDYTEAVKWYRAAAEKGWLPAQINLGGLYEQGKGVPQNYEDAYAWYSVAAAGGNSTTSEMLRASGLEDATKRAAILRDNVATTLTPSALLSAQDLSKQYFSKYGPPSNTKP